jgi:hypothetical protein
MRANPNQLNQNCNRLDYSLVTATKTTETGGSLNPPLQNPPKLAHASPWCAWLGVVLMLPGTLLSALTTWLNMPALIKTLSLTGDVGWLDLLGPVSLLAIGLLLRPWLALLMTLGIGLARHAFALVVALSAAVEVTLRWRQSPTPPLDELGLLLLVLDLVSLGVLFLPASNRWYSERRAKRAKRRQVPGALPL